MHAVLQGFFDYKGERRALGAIAVIVLSVVTVLFNSIIKHLLSLVYLHAYFRQKGKLKRSPVFVNKALHVHAIELQVTVIYFKTLLGEAECLLYKVFVRIIHSDKGRSVLVNFRVNKCNYLI